MALRFKKGTPHRLTVDALAKLADDGEPTYALLEKSRDELRYTFGPLYSPNVDDAHGEFAKAEDLQTALWDYFSGTDKKLRKQHDRDVVIGDVVELVQWPYPLDAELAVAGEVKKFHLPAGTVYAGVRWSEEAWPLVKSGEITGLSMGGRAVRVSEPDPDAFG